ncbi:hypothetical protein KY290_026518, partial [Solanum tuberosum]
EMRYLLRNNLIHLPILDLEFHLQDMDSVILDSGLLVYSLYDIEGEKEDKVLDEMNRTLGFDLPRNIEPFRVMVYLVMQKSFQSNLPRVHGLGYVDFLLKNLKDFQGRYSDSLAFLKNQIQVIQTEFESLQPFLKVVVEEPHNKFKRLNNEDCAIHIIRKAHEVEYVVDACINKGIPHWFLECWLLDIIEEITCIKAKIQEKNTVEDTMKTVIARTSSQLARTPSKNEEIVGFKDVIENLRNQLLNGTKGQDVISIHGMPGLGKTTLANTLYSDSPENEEALLKNSAKPYDLETLSSPYFSRVEDADLMLRKTPNLRKLTCKVECLEYPHQYHALNFPILLEILKLYRSKAFKTIPFCISAPSLKYLKLSGFYLDSQYLSETADHLKNLEVLKLYYVEFGDHREWKVSNGKFPQLKILKLEYLSLMKWIVADDAFPNLEQLVLRGRQDLMEIPSCFMDILSLQYIEVENCNESVVKSAMNIQETQVEDNQNTNFKLVLIEVHY